MGVLSNRFEKMWFAAFMGMYLLIMLPLPWQYSEIYHAGFGGVPIFIYYWLAHGIVTLLLIVIFAKQCLARSDYINFERVQSVDPLEESSS